ncbi:hypothetical protein HUU05_26600 [candidate division KSB1 bacterium]|nr:hypothetical protein [candidate division KSB1 bacterium]
MNAASKCFDELIKLPCLLKPSQLRLEITQAFLGYINKASEDSWSLQRFQVLREAFFNKKEDARSFAAHTSGGIEWNALLLQNWKPRTWAACGRVKSQHRGCDSG